MSHGAQSGSASTSRRAPAVAEPAHTPSSLFLWVLGLSAFCLNLGYGIVIPISEKLAQRCGSGGGPEGGIAAFTAIAIALMSFNLAKILGEVPGGIFSDRVGDRVVLASSLLIYGLSVIMLIEARSYFPFTAARFIEGLATGVSYPAMTSVLLRHSPQQKLGRNMSLALGSGVAGIVLGPAIAGPLMKLSFLGREPIDRPLFFALFLTAIVFAFSVGWFWKAAERAKRAVLDDVKVERTAVVAEGLIVAGPGPVAGASKPESELARGIAHEFAVIARFARSGVFLGLLAPLFFDKMIMAAWQVILLAHAPHVGFKTVEEVGYLMGLLALSFAIVTPISGILADRFSSRWLAHGSLVGIVATLGLFLIANNSWSFVLVFFGYSVFSAMLLTVHLKMVGDLYHEEKQHGRIFGIVHALSDAGMVFGPSLIWLYCSSATLGPIVCFLVMAGLGGLTIPAFLFSQGRDAQLPRP